MKRGTKSGDAKRIFSIMSMAVKQGEEIIITVEGPDENKDAKEWKTFFVLNF